MFKRRDYQQEAIDALFKWWANAETKQKNPVLILPTGAGKTVIASWLMSDLIQRCPNIRIAFMAHQKELISQTEDKLKQVAPTLEIGVYSAGLKRREVCQITVASRQTIARAIGKLGHVDLLIIDEAHMVSDKDSSQYRTIIGKLREVNPWIMILGLSATPYRMTSGNIYGDDDHTIFDGAAYEIPLEYMIENGYLVPPVAVPVDPTAIPELQGIRKTGGDYNVKQLEEVSADIVKVEAALNEWKTIAIDQQNRSHTVFYCVSVAHAELVSDMASDMFGLTLPVVHGDLHNDYRAQLLEDFHAGKYPGLVSVNTLTTGVDIPPICCLVILRATQSRGLFRQIIGRGLRLSPETGKRDCLVLDYGLNVQRFGVTGCDEEPKQPQKTKACPSCKKRVSLAANKCPCGYKFEMGTLTEQVTKVCEKCGEHSPPSAAQCASCGFVFAKHQSTAWRGNLLPNGRELYTVRSYEIHLQEANSGREFIQITYECAGLKFFTRSLFLHYPGLAGRLAWFAWRDMVKPGTRRPKSAKEAFDLYHDKPGVFHIPDVIEIDRSDRWNLVKEVHYKNEA